MTLSALFLWAGLLKLRDAQGTQIAIYQYKILSWELSGIVATFLPFLEITTAAGLWIPRVRLGAVALCVGLLLVFIGALASAVARNLDVSCGCFGTNTLYATALRRLLEDVVLVGLCLPLWRDAKLRFRCARESVNANPQKSV